MNATRSIRAEFEIAQTHPCLPGHFPGRPVVPGVVVLERVLAAIEAHIEGEECMANADAAHAFDRLSFPQVKFAQPLMPMQRARIECEALAMTDVGPRWRFKVFRVSDEALISSGEVQMPTPEPQP